MQRLSKAQIEYANKRIYGLAQSKKEAAKIKFTTGEPLTKERRATLLRQGKVKLLKGITKINGYDDVVDVFDFSKFEPKLDEKRYLKECKSIDAEKLKLSDELMLGDTQRALDIISEF